MKYIYVLMNSYFTLNRLLNNYDFLNNYLLITLIKNTRLKFVQNLL